MQPGLFLAMMLLIPLYSCAPGEGVNGDQEGTYSLAVQDHIISSNDAIRLMQDKTGEPQYDQRLIAHYGEPIHNLTMIEHFLIIMKKGSLLSSENVAPSEDVDHVLQLMDKLLNASAQSRSENTSAILKSVVQLHL
jgi:hypothetical protein